MDDAVFASGTMGEGVAIEPSAGEVVAPCDASVTVMMEETGHAVGLTLSSGLELLIHIGLDTVEMNGDGFTAHVCKGSIVHRGDPLVTFDRKKVARDGLYLVEWMEGGRVTWMGCRRFAIVPTSTGSNIKVDWLADGRWEACDIESNGRLRLGDAELRVVGYVRDVYRSMGNGLVASTRAGSERASQANAEIHGKEVANHG